MAALVILRSEALYIYYGDMPAPVGGSISQTAIADMEVISEDELVSSIAKLVPQVLKAVTPTVLVISEELCFTQAINTKTQEEDKKKFIGVTPFAHVAVSEIVVQEQAYLIATNQDYYESVARILATRGYQIVMVVPWGGLIRFGISKGEVDMVTVKRVFDNISTLRPVSFPFVAEKQEVLPISAPGKDKLKKKISWGWIAFAVGACVYGFVMYWFFIRGG